VVPCSAHVAAVEATQIAVDGTPSLRIHLFVILTFQPINLISSWADCRNVCVGLEFWFKSHQQFTSYHTFTRVPRGHCYMILTFDPVTFSMSPMSRVPASDEFHDNISSHTDSAAVKTKPYGPRQHTDDWYASAGKPSSDLDL